MERAKQYFSVRLTAWYPLLIVVAGFLAYANSFACPFIFDDTTVILNNPHLFHLWPPWKAVLAPTRWLADYSFALNYAWAEFSPADYRIVNVIIHIGSGLLLYGIARRSLMLPGTPVRTASSAGGLALAIALLWTLHPLQTESITYIAQRIEALMGFFFFLTFYLFIRGATAPGPRPWKIAAVAACTLGMGTKEVMATAPVLLILYDGVFLSPTWRGVLNRWRWHAAFCCTWVIVLILLRASLLRAESENVPLVGAGDVRWDYALTQLNVLVHYLKLSLIPYPLCLDYRWPLVDSVTEVLWPGTLTILAGVATLRALWKRSWLGFAGAWFFIILAPTSSINPLPDVAFEHRMYLPLAALVTLVVILTHTLLSRTLRQPRTQAVIGISLTVSCAVILAGLTLSRNETYRSQERMWRDVIQKRPDNFRTYISLANSLIDQGRDQEASAVCHTLLSRLPPFSTMPQDAIEQRFFRPGRPPVHMYYGMAMNNLGTIAMNGHDLETAKQHYHEAIRVFPGAYWAHKNLGHALFSENHVADAIQEWRIALQWVPKDSQTHCLLGMALSKMQAYPDAAKHYETAVSLKPDFLFARSQWAWLLATCPSDAVRNGRRALALAEPLLVASGSKSPRALDILAASYAETGDFSNAVSLVRKAIDLASSMESRPEQGYTLETLKTRLDRYEHKRPWRE